MKVEDRDLRDIRGTWHEGTHVRKCKCGVTYYGGRRSLQCAPCAYGETKKKKVKKKRSLRQKK